MRILRNVLLMVFPLLIMINLYRFVFYSDEYTFRGLSFLHDNLQSFPGLDVTFDVIQDIQTIGTEVSNMKINNVIDVFEAVRKIFQLLSRAIAVPFVLIGNAFMNLWWFIHTLFIA